MRKDLDTGGWQWHQDNGYTTGIGRDIVLGGIDGEISGVLILPGVSDADLSDDVADRMGDRFRHVE